MSVEITLMIGGQPLDAVLDDDAVATIAAAVTPTREPEPEPSPFMTIREAAEFLRTSRGAVDHLLSTGKLTRHKVGTRTLVARAEVEDLVQADDRRRAR